MLDTISVAGFLPMCDTKSRVAGMLAVLLTVLCAAPFLIPAFIIRPFRYQSPRALSLAIALKEIAPAMTAVALVALLVLIVTLWSAASKRARVGLTIAVFLSAASAVMTRLNYFEWMFRPIQAAGFVSVSNAHLADQEMVMAVTIGSEARAYPIRQMAYHHILNDTVAGMPIAVTY